MTCWIPLGVCVLIGVGAWVRFVFFASTAEYEAYLDRWAD